MAGLIGAYYSQVAPETVLGGFARRVEDFPRLSARRKALPPDGRPYVFGPVSRYAYRVSGGGLAWEGPM